MTPNYYLHRISHEWQYSYSLLEKGYLSIGWRCYSEGEAGYEIIDKANISEAVFDEYLKERNDNHRSRWSLFRFLRMKPGDIVLVPMYEKSFAVYRIIGWPEPIGKLRGNVNSIGALDGTKLFDYYGENPVTITREGIPNGDDYYDIGFVAKVELISTHDDSSFRGIGKPRVMASSALNSRMKIRTTNALINDLKDDVDNASSSTKKADIHEMMAEANANHIWTILEKELTDSTFERLVAWYMRKTGADYVEIPSKNESGKTNWADADVIAYYDKLKIKIYVQVKKHNQDTETNDWAIHQITEYVQQKDNLDNPEDDYTHIPWVITNAKSFSEEAVTKANSKSKEINKKIRLITGKEFSRMICDVGLSDIADLEY